MHTQHDNPVIMTVGEAATYLGLAVSTLNKWRCHGGGPIFIKLGRAVRYRAEDLDAFMGDMLCANLAGQKPIQCSNGQNLHHAKSACS